MIAIKQISDKSLDLLSQIDQAEYFDVEVHYLDEPYQRDKSYKYEMIEKFIDSIPNKPRLAFFRAEENPKDEESLNQYFIGEDYIELFFIEWFKSFDDYYSILFHELGHATGAKIRLNRSLLVKYIDPNTTYKNRQKEELVA